MLCFGLLRKFRGSRPPVRKRRRTVDVFFNAVKRSKRRKAGKKCLFLFNDHFVNFQIF